MGANPDEVVVKPLTTITEPSEAEVMVRSQSGNRQDNELSRVRNALPPGRQLR